MWGGEDEGLGGQRSLSEVIIRGEGERIGGAQPHECVGKNIPSQGKSQCKVPERRAPGMLEKQPGGYRRGRWQ